MNEFKNGLKDGIPIALGYFAVSFSFGILAIKGGLSVFQAVLTSVTNVTSAGQFAGLQIIIAGGTILEVILAVAMGYFKEVTFPYMLGLQILPILGWGGGTFAGAVASGLLPKSVCSALSLALYGMFVAIVVPVAKKSKSVLFVVGVAALFSILLYYVPIFHFISTGISIVICTVAAAAIGAIVAPVKKKGEE